MKQLVVFLGLTASGKSHLAGAWAKRHRFPYYNTDIVRKRLAGISSSDRNPARINEGIYSADFTRRTYDEMLMSVVATLQRAKVSCVVVDGSYLKRAERDRLRDRVKELARPDFVLCRCEESITRARLAERAENPAAVSDGTWEIYLLQRRVFEYPHELPEDQLHLVDTDASLDELLGCLDHMLLPAK